MATTYTAPPTIEPTAVYHDGDARLILGLTDATIRRARREGRLRFTRQGRRVLYLGQWLLDWLEAEGTAQEVVR